MKKLGYRIVLSVLMSLVLIITSVAFAQAEDYGDYISTEVTSSTDPAVRESTGDLSALSSGMSGIWTKTVTIRRTFKSLVGITVAIHDATTWWTYGYNWLFSSPRGMANDWWTLPPTFKTGDSAQWDWFHPGYGGTGRSNLQVTFVFGVPTPWGPIGSTFSSRIFTTVRADGTFSYH